MPLCPDESLFKLTCEMAKISERLTKIKAMTLSELTKQIPLYLDTKNSKINQV